MIVGEIVSKWLYRTTALCCAALTVLSFAKPWWAGTYEAVNGYYRDTIEIHAYGIQANYSNPQISEFYKADITPTIEVSLAWIYLVVITMVTAIALFKKDRVGVMLVGGAGLTNVFYIATAVLVVIKGRLYELSISLQGVSYTSIEGVYIKIDSSLQPFFYVACASSIVLVVVSLIRLKSTSFKHYKESLSKREECCHGSTSRS